MMRSGSSTATTLVISLVCCVGWAGTTPRAHERRALASLAADILERARARYAGLKSYADNGVITVESRSDAATPTIVERHTFTTYYRPPRQFFFEFKKDPAVSSERFVVWADGADFNTWWSETRVHDTYPKGQGATAFAVAAFPTKNSVLEIPPLLFAQAGLHGDIVDLTVSRADETEQITGHRCYKLVGEVGLAYSTGTVTDVRPTTVWIEQETLLIRKVLVDTPKGTGAGTVDRMTITIEPEADPQIDDARFKFSVPSAG